MASDGDRALDIAGDTPVERLRALIERLRADDGCPWDREQTAQSVRPNLLEEAHEVAAAIDAGDWDELRGELGDLLFQVGFLARIAEEEGEFDLDGIADAVVEKMIARHPHVFGETTAETAAEVRRLWEHNKKSARDADENGGSALDGVPPTLPALTAGTRLSLKAAALGFDWPDVEGVLDKVAEEALELAQALEGIEPDGDDPAHEFGDLLFAIVNLGRHLGLDPEGALAAANARFRRRFAVLEELLAERGVRASDLEVDALEELWQQAKSAPDR